MQEITVESGIKLSQGPELEEGAVNIQVIDLGQIDIIGENQELPMCNSGGKVVIYLPWTSASASTDPALCPIPWRVVKNGGVWVGLRNLHNALLAAARVVDMKPVHARIYRGSVKDVLRGPTPGTLLFEYSDRYSVFDWGPMPDEIAGKGEALAFIADLVFNYLRTGHHSKGLVKRGGRSLAVREIGIRRPRRNADHTWDYGAYQGAPVDCLVPLEVIFRFAVPRGSSLPERLRVNPSLKDDLGLDTIPVEGTIFSKPIVEFSTKLEDTDRYLTRAEARKISGMTGVEFARLESRTIQIAIELRELFLRADLDLQDGKLEFAFVTPDCGVAGRDFVLVDSVGPDELRLTHDGIQISKELLRRFYSGTDWFKALGEAKRHAREMSGDWKAICRNDLGASPGRLTPEVARIASNIYLSIANSLATAVGEQTPFPSAWDLSDLVGQVRKAGLA
jgi:phosphoribosylaminoimidazole-succinocarboxamide synthase